MKKATVCVLLTLLLACLCTAAALAGTCPNGHIWDPVGSFPATCEKGQIVNYECLNCGAKKSEEKGDPISHSWYELESVQPDCENPGYEKQECGYCHKTTQKVLSALGHRWDEVQVIDPPTCEETGTGTETCKNCGHTLTRTIKAKGHDWKNTRIIREATCAKEGKADAECRTCGKTGTRTLKKKDHTIESWTITKQATENAKGTRKGVCEECGKKITEKFEFVPGDVAIYTTRAKVNLRNGAGTGNKQMGQVAKKGTYLGQLRESQADKDGVVWYKVKYKNKLCWVMSDYADARVDTSDLTKERQPAYIGKELSNIFLQSFEPVVKAMDLEGADDFEYSGDALRFDGENYIENIELTGEGYSIYGVKVGDKIKNALSTLKKKNLILSSDSDDEYTYRIPALPGALAVGDDGCCGYLTVIVSSDNKVEELRLSADLPD